MVVYIFIIGILASYFGSFTSGGVSAISIALMTFFGLSPQLAGVTFKLGKIGDVISSAYVFYKSGHIPKKFLLGGALSLCFGSFLGSYLIFSLSDRVVYLGCGISMLLLVLTSVFRKEKIHSGVISKSRKYFGYVLYFVLSVIGNMFPAGSGVWYYFSNTLVFRLSPLESKGISSILSMFWYTGTFFGVMAQGRYNPWFAASLAGGMLVGSYFGSKHSIKLGNNYMKYVLLSSIFIISVYFIIQGII